MLIHYPTQIALIECVFEDMLLVSVVFRPLDEFQSAFAQTSHPAFVELDKFFKHQSKRLNIPYKMPKLTPFSLSIYKALQKIPYGQTATYKELAQLAGYSNSSRAVGQVLRANPLPLVIPCHRIIKSDGTLGGFSQGLEIKRWLIEFERAGS